MKTGSTRPLEDAFRIAATEMVGWVAAETGLPSTDAQMVSQGVSTPIAQVCDTVYTVVSKMPKRNLLGVDAFGGRHADLRRRATAPQLAELGSVRPTKA